MTDLQQSLVCWVNIYFIFETKKEDCFSKRQKRYVQALLLGGNEILSLTMRKRAIE